MDQQEQVSKIIKRERIERILQRVCNVDLEVLMRVKAHKTVAVKGRARGIKTGDNPSLTIGSISPGGLEFIKKFPVVKVEFVGMKTQIFFYAKITKVATNRLVLTFPQALYSFDRRANARFNVTPSAMAFMTTTFWQASMQDPSSPPVVLPYNDISSWVSIGDISEGGFCLVSRFPAMFNHLDVGMIDPAAVLHLPMVQPRTVPVEVRWKRKVRERIDGTAYGKRFFKLGIQFVSETEDLKIAIKQYIQQISVADAI